MSPKSMMPGLPATGPLLDFDLVAPPRLAAYGDRSWHDRELEALFKPGHGLLYVGHDLLLCDEGYRRADADPRLLLTRDGDTVRAFANVCPHALRPLVLDEQPIDRAAITCPFHRWSFRRDGSFIGGPGCEPSLHDAEPNLIEFPLLSWHGFHFAVEPGEEARYRSELAAIDAAYTAHGVGDWLDMSAWTVYATSDDEYQGDWKVFLEVFGDCYHVPPYHAGLAGYADCDTLDWAFGDNFHIQFVDFAAQADRAPQGYADWVTGLRLYHERKGTTMPEVGVAWTGIYPNLMLETYAGMTVISIAIPTGPNSFVNRAHYCVPADMESIVPGLPAAMKQAFEATGVEDGVLMEARQTGVDYVRSLGIQPAPYRVNLYGTAPEAGTAHFYAWWRRRLGLNADG